MDSSNILNLILVAFYYIVVVLLIFFSIFGIYLLNRYPKSHLLALVTTLLYCVLFIGLLSSSYGLLQNIINT